MRQPSRIAAAAAFLALSTGTAAAVTGYTETALNMRTGPSTSHGVIVAIPGGAPVEVFNCSSGWCHVAWNGYEGYSSRSYLDIGADAYAAAPPAVVVNPPVYDGYDPYYYDRYYVTPGERFVRRGLRHLRREFRQERREDRREARSDRRQDRRETIRDRRRDRRAERRQDVRQERRAERRQNVRQARRADRRQDRRQARRTDRRQDRRVERRQNRREARQERRAERRDRR